MPRSLKYRLGLSTIAALFLVPTLLAFSARWSFHKSLLDQTNFFKISLLIDSLDLNANLNTALKKINKIKIISLLSKDKKLTSKDRLDFIFIEKIGSCRRISVTVSEILAEVKRQKLEY